MFFDGVLKDDSGKPILQGVALFRSLQSHRRTVIICDKREYTEAWLKTNNIVKIDDLVVSEETNNLTGMDIINHCRSKGKIDLVVTADPELATRLLEQGLASVLFLEPKYIRPEFRPDAPRGVRAWEELTTEIIKQDDLYREDPRVNEDHLFGR